MYVVFFSSSLLINISCNFWVFSFLLFLTFASVPPKKLGSFLKEEMRCCWLIQTFHMSHSTMLFLFLIISRVKCLRIRFFFFFLSFSAHRIRPTVCCSIWVAWCFQRWLEEGNEWCLRAMEMIAYYLQLINIFRNNWAAVVSSTRYWFHERYDINPSFVIIAP